MNEECPSRTWLARAGCRWVPCDAVSDKGRRYARRQDGALRPAGGAGAGARNTKTIQLLRRYVIDSCERPFEAGIRLNSFSIISINPS